MIENFDALVAPVEELVDYFYAAPGLSHPNWTSVAGLKSSLWQGNMETFTAQMKSVLDIVQEEPESLKVWFKIAQRLPAAEALDVVQHALQNVPNELLMQAGVQ